MKAKSFFILLVVAGILSGAVYFTIFKGEATPDRQMGETLLTDLPAGEISAVQILSPEGEVLLKKGAQGWTVENRQDFPADFSKLSNLVNDLQGAKAGRSFKGDESIFGRLALNPPEKTDLPPERRGTRVVFRNAQGEPLADILLGAPRESAAASGGHYLRFPGEEEVYLINANFRFLDKTPDAWIQRVILDVPAAEIREVVCRNPADGAVRFALERPAQGKPPELKGPADGEIPDPDQVDRLFGALTSLRIQDVAAPDVPPETTGLGDAASLAFHLFDGTVYHVYKGAQVPEADDYFLQIKEEGFNRKFGTPVLIISDWVEGMLVTDRRQLCQTAD